MKETLSQIPRASRGHLSTQSQRRGARQADVIPGEGWQKQWSYLRFLIHMLNERSSCSEQVYCCVGNPFVVCSRVFALALSSTPAAFTGEFMCVLLPSCCKSPTTHTRSFNGRMPWLRPILGHTTSSGEKLWLSLSRGGSPTSHRLWCAEVSISKLTQGFWSDGG